MASCQKKKTKVKNAPAVPEGDFISIKGAPMYYISIDPSGRLGWEQNTLEYAGNTATVIEVLTERAGNAYKALLRNLNIPYIIVGKEDIDPVLTMEKLHECFGLTCCWFQQSPT